MTDMLIRKGAQELIQRAPKILSRQAPARWSKRATQAVPTGYDAVLKRFSSETQDALKLSETTNDGPLDPSDVLKLRELSQIKPDVVEGVVRDFENGNYHDFQGGLRSVDDELSKYRVQGRNNPTESLEPKPPDEPIVPADQGIAEDFIRAGGGQDQELANILKEGSGPKARLRTYDELVSEIAELKKQRKALKAGPEKKKLDNKIKGLETKKDKADSWVATKWDETGGDRPATYQNRKYAQPASTAESQDLPGWQRSYHKNLEFHHKNMKVLVSAFHRKLRKLRELGSAVDQDIIDLHRLDEAFGVESGSREAAALRMHRATHGYMHREIMLQWHEGMSPIQPDQFKWTGGKARLAPGDVPEEATKQVWDKIKNIVETKDDVDYILNYAGKDLDIDRGIKQFKKAKKEGTLPVPDNKSDIDRWLERIEAAESPAEIKELYQEMLEDITGPMTKEAELMERVARNQLTKEELIADDRATIAAARGRQIEADELAENIAKDRAEIKQDKKLRQRGG